MILSPNQVAATPTHTSARNLGTSHARLAEVAPLQTIASAAEQALSHFNNGVSVLRAAAAAHPADPDAATFTGLADAVEAALQAHTSPA